VCSSVEASHEASRASSAFTRGPQVRLLGRDDVGRVEVTDERARGAGAPDVQRRRDADQRDGGDLEHVAEVEAERHRADDEVRVERDPEPGAADGDGEVGGPLVSA
jgi:hypothetical protein